MNNHKSEYYGEMDFLSKDEEIDHLLDQDCEDFGMDDDSDDRTQLD